MKKSKKFFKVFRGYYFRACEFLRLQNSKLEVCYKPVSYKKPVDDFHSLGNADYVPVHLPLLNLGDFHSLDNADYGPVHSPL